ALATNRSARAISSFKRPLVAATVVNLAQNSSGRPADCRRTSQLSSTAGAVDASAGRDFAVGRFAFAVVAANAVSRLDGTPPPALVRRLMIRWAPLRSFFKALCWDLNSPEGRTAMNRIKLVAILAVLGIATFVVISSIYTVSEVEQAIITQFGKPIGAPVTTAGLKVKVPFIQHVNLMDKRVLGNPTDMPTKDKLYISVDLLEF